MSLACPDPTDWETVHRDKGECHKVKAIHKVIPAFCRYVRPRDPESAGLRGPTYRLGGRNDEGFGLKYVPDGTMRSAAKSPPNRRQITRVVVSTELASIAQKCSRRIPIVATRLERSAGVGRDEAVSQTDSSPAVSNASMTALATMRLKQCAG